MELTELTIGLIIMAFVLGAVAGWFVRKPTTLTTISPDIEREKTLFEAQHQSLIEDVQAHLTETAESLERLAAKQQALAAELRGEPATETRQDGDLIEALPPRDYADARGQLSS